MGQPGFARGDDVELPPLAKPAEPDIVVRRRPTAFECGGRRFECISVPGGETIDSLVRVAARRRRRARRQHVLRAVRPLPEPRDDARRPDARARSRSSTRCRRSSTSNRRCCSSATTGRCAARATVRARVRTHPRRDALRARRDRRGDERRATTCGPRCARSRCPTTSSVGQAYGRVDWSVRAIWESYAGWFHQHSTLDLYGAAPEHGAAEIVDARRWRRRGRRARAARLARDRSAHRRAALRDRARGRRRAPSARSTRTAPRTSSSSPSTGARTSG